MSEKTLKSRIIHKHDTEANWLLATNFIPKKGELIVYDPDADHDYSRCKIGNGTNNVNDLDFLIKPSPTPDWNQNDETAPDYIKNRPFYVETGFIEILPERIIWFDQDNSYYSLDAVDVTIGNTYVIKFDGVEYACVARSYNMGDGVDFAILGNVDAALGTGSSGEPFIMFCVPAQYVDAAGVGLMIQVFDSSYLDHAIMVSIKGYVDNFIHKIDEKFLPDNVGGIKYVNIGYDENDEFIADATYDQITEWITAGIDVRCLLDGAVFTSSYSDPLKEISPFLSMPNHHEFVSTFGDFKQVIIIYDSNVIDYTDENFFLDTISRRLNIATAEDLENAITAEAEARAAEDAKKLDITTANSTFVPVTRMVNNKALNSDISLIASDVGAYTKEETDSAINTAKNSILGTGQLVATYDTLQEIGTWIQNSGVDATELSSAIAAEAKTRADEDAKKVDKVSGKGLSTNDYTTNEKTKLSGIEAGAQKNTITGVKGSAESSYRTGNVNITAENVGAVPTSRTINSKALSSNITLSAADVSAVPTTRKVNNKALSSDISLTASDVGAVPTTRKVNNKALSSDISLAASDVGAVPTSRTINNKALSSNITLSASDVGAYTKNEVDNRLSLKQDTVDAYTKNEVDNRLNLKQDTITGAATSITTDDLTEGRALVSSTTGKVVAANTTAGEIGFLSGVKNNVQTQLDGKVPTTRTVNGKALSSNVTLSASDVGAYTKAETDTAIATAKTYTDEVKAELLGTEQLQGTYDTLKEIGHWIQNSGVDATELSSAIAAEAQTRADEDAKKLDKTGGEMTGTLTFDSNWFEGEADDNGNITAIEIAGPDYGITLRSDGLSIGDSSIDPWGVTFVGGSSEIVLDGHGESGYKATLTVNDEASLKFEDENGDACGTIGGLIDASSDDQAVPYGQMKEYSMPKYNEGILTYQDDPELEGKTYCVNIPDFPEEPKIGMELTIIPHVTSVITGPSLSINGGEKVGMRVTASTTNSSFNGTRPDFMNVGAPVKLMYMERRTQSNAAYAVLSNGQKVYMAESGTWSNGYYIDIHDNSDEGDGVIFTLCDSNGNELEYLYAGEDYNGEYLDVSSITSWGTSGIYYFSNGTDETTTNLWRILNSTRTNAEALMSNNAEGGGMYPCTPGKANEKLIWNTPAKVGVDINKNSILTATSTDGVAYTVTLDGVTKLYNGLQITILPNTTSTSKSATLDLNGLGAKPIRLAAHASGGAFYAYNEGFLAKNRPVILMYEAIGERWITVNINRPVAEAISGQIAVTNGGTGRDTLTSGRYLVGNGTGAVTLKTKAQVLSDIGALKNDTITAVNLNTIEDGLYRVSTSCTNIPVSGVASIVLSKTWDDNYAFQLASLHNRDYLYYRVKTNGTWDAWKTIYSNSNLSFDGSPKSGSTNPITSGGVYNALNELKSSVSEGKALIASAVTDKGVETADNATFAEMAANIAAIESGGDEFEESLISVIERTAATPALPERLTKIENSAFCEYQNLALTSLPSGVKSIGNYAFQNCTNLALTSLPSGLTVIGHGAFENCTNLALTSLPSGVRTIGNYAFRNCSSLQSLTFEGTPILINRSTFNNCANLTTINVPWAQDAVANAPWGATNATINYNYTGG